MKAGSVETRTFYTEKPGADATRIYRSYIHTYLARIPWRQSYIQHSAVSTSPQDIASLKYDSSF